MIKFSGHKGFSFYDIIISLSIFILASFYTTSILAKTIELRESSKATDFYTFKAIETIENLKALNSLEDIETVDYFSDFNKSNKGDMTIYTKDFDINGREYTEKVYISIKYDDTINQINKMKVFSDGTEAEIEYRKYINTLYSVDVEILKDSDELVYGVSTFINERYKEEE